MLKKYLMRKKVVKQRKFLQEIERKRRGELFDSIIETMSLKINSRNNFSQKMNFEKRRGREKSRFATFVVALFRNEVSRTGT